MSTTIDEAQRIALTIGSEFATQSEAIGHLSDAIGELRRDLTAVIVHPTLGPALDRLGRELLNDSLSALMLAERMQSISTILGQLKVL